MKDIKKKLNDRQGAAILIALMFMLVCMVTGASVLFASASNAGKARSNKEEQQKYLSVSSALNLICDELTDEDVYYIGHYDYQKTDISDPSNLLYTYQQEEGELVKSTASGPVAIGLNEVLPLYDLLDKLLSEEYASEADKEIYNGDFSEMSTFVYAERPDAGSLVDSDGKITATLIFHGGDYDDSIMHNVVITAELLYPGEPDSSRKYSLKLTAELEDGTAEAYRMEAELVQRSIPGKPHYPQIPVPNPYENPSEHHGEDKDDGSQTGAVGWELSNIKRK